MKYHSINTVCALTGANRANLRRWLRGGMISEHKQSKEWSAQQIDEVLAMISLTSGGATLRQIQHQHHHTVPYAAGWTARRGDLLWQLELGSDRELMRTVRTMASDYSSDDFINILMKPLNVWLRDDTRCGASRRLSRFHDAVSHHSGCVMRAASRQNDTPLLLEVVSVGDQTEIWLEAIRLSGQGFCVEVDERSQGNRVETARPHEHHLLWCGAGISPEMMTRFNRGLRAGKLMQLSGPDCAVRGGLSSSAGNDYQASVA